MEEQVKEIRESALKEIERTVNLAELNDLRIKYLGKKSEFTQILRGMGALSAEERPIIGNLVNEVKNEIEEKLKDMEAEAKLKQLQENLKNEKLDVTMPSKKNQIGTIHPITKVIEEVKEVFLGLGYKIADGPEIELSEYNFDKLNAPLSHPSRDLQDTIYVTDSVLLRSQTSPVQARVMETEPLPIKIICPGRVYRQDSVDATHSPVFHQIEGLVVDKNITMADLKGTLEVFVKSCLGKNVNLRFRPHYFPFTEPSAEADVTCFVCGGKGCRVCKNEGWIELLGCGMVHPNVLKNCGIDPKEYSGFAFGFGGERIAMAKYGIDDMRLLYENDARFLRQF